ncbi:MAG TPA: hypothetical protein VKT17_10780 [Acidobacteriota bacterium]|nr:hypothetical protein [Acidobacteriota bacterium]
MNEERPRTSGRAMTGHPLSRREVIRLGLAGSALAWLGPSCQEGSNKPKPPGPPGTQPVYELTPGTSLYDDFDGHGSFQTYDNRDLATAGALNPLLWYHDDSSRVLDSALASPYSAPADNGLGRPLGPAPVSNNVLEIRCVNGITAYAWLGSPREIEFLEFRSLGADVMLSSRSGASRPSAFLNFHTTIPEQPPGRSWQVSLGIFKGGAEAGGAFVIGQYMNINLGIIQNDYLGPVALDQWRSLRLDILTKADDPELGEQDIRLDYYLDGALKMSRIPEDSAILIDPERTALGPHRSLIVNREADPTGPAFGYFDNVRAVYRNRVG